MLYANNNGKLPPIYTTSLYQNVLKKEKSLNKITNLEPFKTNNPFLNKADQKKLKELISAGILIKDIKTGEISINKPIFTKHFKESLKEATKDKKTTSKNAHSFNYEINGRQKKGFSSIAKKYFLKKTFKNININYNTTNNSVTLDNNKIANMSLDEYINNAVNSLFFITDDELKELYNQTTGINGVGADHKFNLDNAVSEDIQRERIFRGLKITNQNGAIGTESNPYNNLNPTGLNDESAVVIKSGYSSNNGLEELTNNPDKTIKLSYDYLDDNGNKFFKQNKDYLLTLLNLEKSSKASLELSGNELIYGFNLTWNKPYDSQTTNKEVFKTKIIEMYCRSQNIKINDLAEQKTGDPTKIDELTLDDIKPFHVYEHKNHGYYKKIEINPAAYKDLTILDADNLTIDNLELARNYLIVMLNGYEFPGTISLFEINKNFEYPFKNVINSNYDLKDMIVNKWTTTFDMGFVGIPWEIDELGDKVNAANNTILQPGVSVYTNILGGAKGRSFLYGKGSASVSFFNTSLDTESDKSVKYSYDYGLGTNLGRINLEFNKGITALNTYNGIQKMPMNTISVGLTGARDGRSGNSNSWGGSNLLLYHSWSPGNNFRMTGITFKYYLRGNDDPIFGKTIKNSLDIRVPM